MVLYGASGHGLVVQDILEQNQDKVIAYFDNDTKKKEYNSMPVMNDYSKELFSKEKMIITIGDCQIRKSVVAAIGHAFGKAISDQSVIARKVKIEEGTVVFQGAVIQTNVVIGKHCIINTSSSVDHECIIADFCHIAPNATLCGSVKLGEGSFVGAGATVIQCVTIGKNVTIGAGTVVIRDVPDGAVVVGNPGRIVKYK